MKKLISKMNLVFLLFIIVSIIGQNIFADTLVDKEKAYNICMQYHPPRIQDLCSQITDGTTYEQILAEHNSRGYDEVVNEKNNMIKVEKVTPKVNSDTTKSKNEVIESNDKEKSTTETNTNNSTNNTTTKKATDLEKQILTFAYSSFVWKVVNVVLVAFFALTYLLDRYKYFKRKSKKK